MIDPPGLVRAPQRTLMPITKSRQLIVGVINRSQLERACLGGILLQSF
jgi:hypothetical protein